MKKKKKNEGLILSHHGVMGMKWGVHRFQDKQGLLTKRGVNKANKVADSKILSKIHEQRYKTILARNYHDSSKKATKYERAANNDRNSIEKRAKYQKMAQQYTQRSKMLLQTFKDVESKKLKAGQDYIVQKDYDFYGPIVKRTSRAIRIH